MVTLEDCQRHVNGHVNANTRMAQDSMMLYFFILGSLSESAKLLVITEKESYAVAKKSFGSYTVAKKHPEYAYSR